MCESRRTRIRATGLLSQLGLLFFTLFPDPVDSHLMKHAADCGQQCLNVCHRNPANCSDSEARFMGQLARVNCEAEFPKSLIECGKLERWVGRIPERRDNEALVFFSKIDLEPDLPHPAAERDVVLPITLSARTHPSFFIKLIERLFKGQNGLNRGRKPKMPIGFHAGPLAVEIETQRTCISFRCIQGAPVGK